MTCATCVKTIENSISQLDGIIEINVNLAAEKALITYNPNIINPEEMKEALECFINKAKEKGYPL